LRPIASISKSWSSRSPAAHREKRPVVSDEDVALLEQMRLDMHAVLRARRFPLVRLPAGDDVVPRFAETRDERARQQVGTRERRLGGVGELAGF